MGKKIEPLEQAEAKKRQQDHNGTAPGRSKNTSGKFPEVNNSSNGQTRDKVGQAVGLSGKSYTKAKKVVEFAIEFPEYGYIVEEMDTTGKIDRAAKEMNPPPFPPAMAAPAPGNKKGWPSGQPLVLHSRIA